MSHSTQRRRATSRPPLRVEWLESRLLLSNDIVSAYATASPPLAQVSAASSNAPLSNNLTILSVNPASGSTSSTSPAAITFTFDRPIDPFSLGSDNDFDLLQVAPDGTTTSIYYDVNPSPTESLDATGTQLTLTLNRQLGPGEYQVILRGSSSLAGIDGSMTANAGNDQLVTDFTIAASGVTRADATDLGTIGSPPVTIQGSLNFQTNPGDVALYKVTLADGHFWRLGLEVTAQRDGSSLDSALALFDAQGNPIATDEFGRTDDPLDPFLFAGLPPGTYYVGVSGTQNLPGNPGGYNLITGSPGSVSQNQTGGPFTLHVVADPEDAPPSVLTFSTNYGDPIGSSPTGLTLGFSDAIRLSSTVGSLSSTLSAGIEVVDQSGQVWPVLASGYSETSAQVSFLFADPLPEGQYTVRLPAQGGLLDLAGLAPVAPGQPSGVLGTFKVGPQASAAQNPYDFGALLPSIATQGVYAVSQLAPGESVTYRFVITFPGIYTFQNNYSGGSLAIERTGPDGAFALDPGVPGGVNPTNDTPLSPGIYRVTLTATGSEAVQAQLTIRSPSGLPESILANGVGQGPALELRLIAPAAAVPSPNVDSADAAPLGPVFALPSAPAGSGNVVVNAPSVSAGLFVSLGGSMVGRPTPGGDSVAPVGPSIDGSSVALASSSVVLQQGIAYRPGMRARSSIDIKGRTREAWKVEEPPAPALPETLAINHTPVAEQNGQLDHAADEGWFNALVDSMVQGFATQAASEPIAVAELVPPALPVATEAALPAPEAESHTIKLSTITASIAIGLTVVLVVHHRRWFHRVLWSKRRRYATLHGDASALRVQPGAK